jgi:hypothetical protein
MKHDKSKDHLETEIGKVSALEDLKVEDVNNAIFKSIRKEHDTRSEYVLDQNKRRMSSMVIDTQKDV